MSDANIGEAEGTELVIDNDDSLLADKPIACIDCAGEFTWTAGEQAFFRDKKLKNPPKRCKPCKKLKNERLAAVERAHTTGIKQRIEVSAECARCFAVTTVPFFPSQGRPVYCRACFLEVTDAPNGRPR
jgi:CxxC-x17-CxxC domain-containing protein